MEDGAWLGDCPGVDIVVAFEKESDWQVTVERNSFRKLESSNKESPVA